MPLYSKLFRGSPNLEAYLRDDEARIQRGDAGDHIGRLQTALFVVDDEFVTSAELNRAQLGSSTMAALLAYKRRRNMVSYASQLDADNVLDRDTLRALDRELCVLDMQEDAPAGRSDFSISTLNKGKGTA